MKKIFNSFKKYILLSLFIPFLALGQNIRGETNPCPNVDYDYELEFIPTNCSPTWSLWDTNGQNPNLGTITVNQNDPAKAKIKWNAVLINSPYIRVSYTGTNCTTSPKNSGQISVKSIAGRVPIINTINNFKYCDNIVRLSVTNTADFTNADSWEWVIPSNWTFISQRNSSVVEVQIPDGCSKGIVKARAKGAVFCSAISNHYSEYGEINVQRGGANASIIPPSPNYEARCGVRTPVTFAVAQVPSCGRVIWDLPQGWQTSTGGTGTVAGPAGSTSIILIPSGSNGGALNSRIQVCSDFVSNFSYAINFNALADIPPGGSIEGDLVRCKRQTKTYTAPYYPDVHYQWLYNGELVGTNSHTFAAPNSPGLALLQVQMTKGAGCSPVTLSKNIWYGIPPEPIQFTAYTAGGGIPVNGTSIIYTNSWSYTAVDLLTAAQIILPGSSDGYIWEHNGVIIEGNGASNVILLPPSAINDFGTVKVRTFNSCGQSAAYTWNYQTIVCNDPYGYNCGIGSGCDPCIGNRISNYPNPANNVINIDNSYDEDVVIKLMDRFGNTVVTENVQKNNKTVLNTEKLPNGIYYLNKITSKETKKEKIIISHK